MNRLNPDAASADSLCDSEVQRYLLAEMDGVELAAFEGRLAADPDLCDAVAEAVSLFAAMPAVPASSSVPLRFGGIRPLRMAAAGVLLIGAAVSLMTASSSSSSPSSGDAASTQVAQVAAASERAERVLSLWLVTDDESDPTIEDSADSDAADSDSEFGVLAEDGDEIDGEWGEWDVPEWMLVGVREGR